jgi:hypothetical protein
MSAGPKRRWLQFSLRTMLLATVAVAVMAAWHASVIRERKAVLSYARAHGVWMGPKPHPNVFRRWLGDVTVRSFVIGSGYEFNDEDDRLRAAFPEAEVIWFEPPDDGSVVVE